jgi:hypothetical protein
LREGFNAHGLGGDHDNDGGFILFNEFGFSFDWFTGSLIDFVNKGGEFTGDMGSVAIKDWGISGIDLSGVVHDNDLSLEGFGFLGWVILGVRGNVSSSDILDG